MLIEFSCPVCQTSLAIKKQTVGGQVNCPKCQKLILLPSESPLPRHNPDKVPFAQDQVYPVQEVTKAICVSVEPYRRDLETKSNLLNDAVEMVKIRNERIRELETLMLTTQAELWALEASMDEQDRRSHRESELEEMAAEQRKTIEKLESRLYKVEGLEQEWAQDRETARHLRLEMEDNLQLLRDRIEQERDTYRKALRERETEVAAAGEKKLNALLQKFEKSKEELAASETKRLEALKSQQALTQQTLASEEELRKLKVELQNALDRIEQLESEDGPAYS